MSIDKTDITHKIAVSVDKELYDKVQEHIPWGSLKHVVIAMLEDLIHLCEKHDSRLIVGAVLSKDITLKDFLNKFDPDGDDKRPKDKHIGTTEE